MVENIKYLKSQFSHLGRGGNLYGLAENREDELARHVQAFIIKSISSNYSEMVQLTPVICNNSDFLILELKSVIK